MQMKSFGKMRGVTEADETWVGGKRRRVGSLTGMENKTPVVALVKRDGKVRSLVVQLFLPGL